MASTYYSYWRSSITGLGNHGALVWISHPIRTTNGIINSRAKPPAPFPVIVHQFILLIDQPSSQNLTIYLKELSSGFAAAVIMRHRKKTPRIYSNKTTSLAIDATVNADQITWNIYRNKQEQYLQYSYYVLRVDVWCKAGKVELVGSERNRLFFYWICTRVFNRFICWRPNYYLICFSSDAKTIQTLIRTSASLNQFFNEGVATVWHHNSPLLQMFVAVVTYAL